MVACQPRNQVSIETKGWRTISDLNSLAECFPTVSYPYLGGAFSAGKRENADIFENAGNFAQNLSSSDYRINISPLVMLVSF